VPPIPTRNGWGVQASLVAVQSQPAANVVNSNVGIGAQVLADTTSIRLTEIGWRVDITPDVAAGVASGPTRYRVVVFATTTFPADVSVWQQQQFPNGAHPEIPTAVGPSAPSRIIFDRWLDFANGDPGLSQVASQLFADAGPMVMKGDTLCAILVPILDANIAQLPLGPSNAFLYLEVWGRDCEAGYIGAAAQPLGGDFQAASVPRYAVQVP
jgi:hypothetical protein